MMYFEDKKHRIQADMARRIGEIAVQYGRVPRPPEEDFSETLHLCLLQSLLTHCKELLEAMNRSGDDSLGLHISVDKMTSWGLEQIQVTRYSFEENLTVAVFLTHMRNAMSHPTGTDPGCDYPSTGYNAIKDAQGMIEKVAFCDSPDTRDNRPKEWRTQAEAERHFSRAPSDIRVERVGSRFRVSSHGYPYTREFLAILSTEQLRSLVMNLSTLLAQPARDHWDGKSIIYFNAG
jgi:hypothetical protein